MGLGVHKNENKPLIRQCTIALRIQKMNAEFLSLYQFYFSTKPNFFHGQLIKGISVCIRAKYAWISLC